jgi:hypothetical protein
MAHAVNLHYQFGAMTEEVNHVRANRMLTAKPHATDLAIAQGEPQEIFGWRFVTA